MPRPGMCTDNAATDEDAIRNELLLRDVADRVVHGETFASIGRDLQLDRRTIAKIARQARDLVTEETRAELAVAQAREFKTLNSILRRLEPYVCWDYEREAHGEPQAPPDPNLITQYWHVVRTIVIVMTADRGATTLREPAARGIDDVVDAGMEKARLVREYIDLADKIAVSTSAGDIGVCVDDDDLDDVNT